MLYLQLSYLPYIGCFLIMIYPNKISDLNPFSAEPAITITDKTIVLDRSSVIYKFKKLEKFTNSFMIFGGGEISHKNAINDITLSLLSMKKVKNLSVKYPDFYMCSSPGAKEAQSALLQLNLVSTSSDVSSILKHSLKKFNTNIRLSKERVCILLSGYQIKLMSANTQNHEIPLNSTVKDMKYALISKAEIFTPKKKR